MVWVELSELPALEGWLTFPEAAVRLGVSPQAVHKMAQTERLTTCRRVGGSLPASRPLYVVREAEIERFMQEPVEAEREGWIPVPDAVAIMGVPAKTVHNWIKSGKLRSRELVYRNQLRVRRDEAEAYAAEQGREAPGAADNAAPAGRA